MSEVNRSYEGLNAIPTLSLTTVLESIPDAVIVVDTITDEIIAVNDAAGELFECRPQTLVGHTRHTLHPAENRNAYDTAFSRARESKQVERLPDGSPLYIETQTGECVPVEINAQRIQKQNRTFVLGVFRDISARLERQQQLRTTTTRLKTLLDAAPLPIAALDREGRIQLWNQAAEDTFGYSSAEIVGESYPLLTEESLTNLLNRILDGEDLNGYETVLRTKDGSRLHTELFAQPLYGDDDTVTGVIGTAVDITDRKRRRHALEVLHRVLRHNLRNKLTIIQGHTSALKNDEGPDSGLTQKAAEKIETAAADLAGLSRQVTQSQFLTDKSVTRSKPLNLEELVITMEAVLAETTTGSVAAPTADETVAIPAPANSAIGQLLSHTGEYMSQPAIDVTVDISETEVVVTIRGNEPLLADSHHDLLTRGVETELNHGLGLDIAQVYLTLLEIGGEIELVGRPIPETALQVTLPRLNQ
ncbi:PAS domain S-box protein [Halapricum desulfuricans]|uniref:Signal transduction histidine kinase with PAS and REC domains n=1 Tax=Halapricum desulfuricans TaxID=2841257 RepID=A0A897MT05_9EURY|nr:PAS domain S-box protein [Halapricum desulfuricans]QSG05270.1 Signal transduction histidine kinase with PAS and REC domains [Halapricum desulfuricans]